MTQIKEPNCSIRKCKHFQGVESTPKMLANGEAVYEATLVCAAFPDGIPHDIAFGDNLHTISIPGDNGIVYERGNDEEDEDDEEEGDEDEVDDNDDEGSDDEYEWP